MSVDGADTDLSQIEQLRELAATQIAAAESLNAAMAATIALYELTRPVSEASASSRVRPT